MQFKITAINENGETTMNAPSPREAMDMYLNFYRGNYRTVLVEDDKGRALSLDQLSCLCEAAED